MIPAIYGNDSTLRLIRTMAGNGRIPHACLLTGEKGSGRRTIARYLSMAALCTGDAPPCGECPDCRRVLRGTHPDVEYVEHSGKKNGFSVDTVRRVCRESIIAPNEGGRKVYIFADCDGMDIRSQNTLLKLTEEPPEHVLLIFTAEHKGAFLPTMLSRMMCLPVGACTPEDTCRALAAMDCLPEAAQRAAQVCGGNIGRALEFLHSEKMQEMVRHVTALSHAIASRNGYDILRIFSLYEKDRAAAAELLRLLDMQLRDAAVQRFSPDLSVGCDPASAGAVCGAVSLRQCLELHGALQEAVQAIQGNVSVKLTLASLGGQLVS